MPIALAIASAIRGFLRGVSSAGAALVFVVIGVGQIENDRLALASSVLFLVVDRSAITFIKDRLGDHVLFAGPVAQVPQTAALAAEGKSVCTAESVCALQIGHLCIMTVLFLRSEPKIQRFVGPNEFSE